jgi:hypothetical protein
VKDTTTPIFDTISNPGGATDALADGAQQVTDAAGVSLAQLSPQLGDAVSATGQQVATTVRDVPLPGHVLPGY